MDIFNLKLVDTKYTYKGEPVKILKITPKMGKTFTSMHLASLVEGLAEQRKDKSFGVNIRLPDLGWRSGPTVKFGDEINFLRDNQQYDLIGNEDGDPMYNIMEASIVISPVMKTAGGCLFHSASTGQTDCLFRCLQRAYAGHLPFGLRTDAEMREAIGAPKEGLIPASAELFAKLESKLGPTVKVQVVGDFTYASSKQCIKSITIELYKEHYEFRCQPGKDKPHCVRFKQDPHDNSLLRRIVKIEDDKAYLEDINGTIEVIPKKDYLRYRCLISASSKSKSFIFIDEPFDKYLAKREDLLSIIDLNLYGSLQKYVCELFRTQSQLIPTSEPLSPLEEMWISGYGKPFGFGCMRGGIVYHKDGEYDNCVAYDVRSMYPSVMNSSLMIPLCKPVEKYLTELPEHPAVGLYRCKITVPDNNKPLWRGGTSSSIYTQRDIEIARMLGADIQLADDGEINALIYNRNECVRAQDVFGSYINKLYPLKAVGNKTAKLALNMLWGKLCEKSRTYLNITGVEEPKPIPGIIIGAGCNSLNQDYLIIKEDNKPFYSGDMPRVGPFITSHARSIMVKIILPYVDKMVRCHTDGFVLSFDLSDCFISDKTIGQNMGQLKIEHSGKCVINGMRKPIFN